MAGTTDAEVRLNGRDYRITADSIKGRRGENQDTCAWRCVSGEEDRPDMLVAVVCDGMGGMVRGGEAARRVCDGLMEWAEAHRPTDMMGMTGSFIEALEDIEKELRRDIPGTGTTVSAVLSTGGEWMSVHVGDSRCYRISGDDVWRTRDHSPVEDLFRQGRITEEAMNTHPRSNIVDLYIGGGHAGRADAENLGDSWDRLVLCTDGAFGCMPVPLFQYHLRNGADAGGIVRAAYDELSADNITVLAIDRLRSPSADILRM